VRELPIARPKFRFSLLYGGAPRALRTVPCPIVSEWSLPGDYERIEPGFPQRRLNEAASRQTLARARWRQYV
jgi:hypothetical protein